MCLLVKINEDENKHNMTELKTHRKKPTASSYNNPTTFHKGQSLEQFIEDPIFREMRKMFPEINSTISRKLIEAIDSMHELGEVHGGIYSLEVSFHLNYFVD